MQHNVQRFYNAPGLVMVMVPYAWQRPHLQAGRHSRRQRRHDLGFKRIKQLVQQHLPGSPAVVRRSGTTG